jgi:hypothetical protein
MQHNSTLAGARSRERAPQNTDFMTARKLSLLLWAALALMPLSALAQASINVATSPGFPGSVTPLPILVRKTTNVTAAQFDLTYNAARVTSGDGVLGGVFSNHVVRTREIAPGVRRVLIFSRTNASLTVTNTRTIAQIPFTVRPLERIGSGPIVPSNARLAQPNASPIAPLGLNSGAIFVQPVSFQPEGAQLFLPSEIGVKYVIEATTNFVQWTDIATNTASGEFLTALDPFAVNFPYRFYRSRRDP